MGYIVAIVSAVLAVAWVPVAVFFWKAWRRRGAPLSLAICALIAFPIYTNLSAWLFLRSDPIWTVSVLAAVNLMVLSNFYLCFYWQKKAFPDARRDLPAERPKFWQDIKK